MNDSRALSSYERESVMDKEYRSYLAGGDYNVCKRCGDDYGVHYDMEDVGLCPRCKEDDWRYEE